MAEVPFNVNRVGDPSRAASVQWSLEGDLAAADLAAGQPTSGVVNWAAGETAQKTITINTSGNTAVGPDKACRVRLSNPVNATLDVSSATTIVLDDDGTTPGDLPSDFPTVPTFGGSVDIAHNRTELQGLINNSRAGDNRISCIGGVDFGDITLDRPTNHRFEIICVQPRFTGMNATKRSDLTLTSQNDTNCSSKVVQGNVSRSLTSGINLVPVQAGVMWIEGFDLRPGQQINDTSGAYVGDLWLRRIRFDTTNGLQLSCGRDNSSAGRLIEWENWHYSDGTQPGQGANSTGFLTDYGTRLYGTAGYYAFKTLWEGGYNHMCSGRSRVAVAIADSCIWMPWGNQQISHMAMFNWGQSGGSNANPANLACGILTLRNGVWGTWSAGRNTNEHYGVQFQAGRGLVFENMMVYPEPTGEVDNFLTLFGHTGAASDSTNTIGSGNIRVRGNQFLNAANRPILNNLFSGSWAGTTITFENNTTPSTIAVQNKGSRVTVVHGQNSGFSG